MPRKRVVPPPPQAPAPQWQIASAHVLFARRHVNTIGRYRERLYAYPMKFEPIDTGEHETEITFECVSVLWYNTNALGLSVEEFWQAHPSHPVSRVTLRLGPSINSLPSGGIRFGAQVQSAHVLNEIPNQIIDDGRWYLITLAHEVFPRPPVARFEMLEESGDYGQEYELSLLRLETPSAYIEQDLAGKYGIDGSTVQAQAMLDNQEVAFVGVLNVGQGGCNALYGTDGRPFLYYDFGRATGKSSRPDSMRPCLGAAPQIVLSNWDQDHFELARSYPEARHLPWLCLEGRAGPNTGTFFRSLAHKRVWPAARAKFEEYSWGFILRANDPGGNSNDSGLVMLVRVCDDSAAPPVGQRRALDTAGSRPEIFPDERYVLMTGDAMFQHIPSCLHHDLDGKIIGINAVHHGSYNGMEGKEHFIPLAADPLDNQPATVAFSYGFNRHTGTDASGYGHPMYEAVNAYKFRGYYLRMNTNAPPAGDPAHWAPANLVLGWRRGAVPPPADGAAANIAVARGLFDTAVLGAHQAHLDAQATFLLLDAATIAKNGTAIHVVAAVNAVMLTPAFMALAISPGLPALIAAALAAAGTRATGVLACADVITLDNQTYDAAVLAANPACLAATNLSQVVAAHDPAYPAVQTVHCQGAVQLAQMHAPPWPVTQPPQCPATAISAPLAPTPLRPIQIDETLLPTRVLHAGHRLQNGAQVTLAGSAHPAANAVHTITFVSPNEYTIPVTRGGLPVTEHVFVTSNVAGLAAQQCVIQDSGAVMTLVRHAGHALQAGTQVTLANAPNFNGVYHFQPVDLDTYAIVVPGVVAGAGVAAQASGRRMREKFKVRCAIADGGAGNTVITHAGHRLLTGNKVDIQGTTHPIHAGRRKITVLTVNTYSIAASLGVVFAQANVTVEGTRTQFAFANENVELTVGRPVSTVVYPAHGMATGDYVTIAAPTNAVYAGVHRVTVINPGHFQIDAGTANGAAYHGQVSRHIRHFQNVPVSLTDLGRISIVSDPRHGLGSGTTVHIQGTASYNGAHVITVLDADHYAIAAVNGMNNHEAGQALATLRSLPFANEPVLTRDNAVNATDVYHPNHGLPDAAQVTLGGGAHIGPHVIARIDSNHYRLPHTTGHLLVESGVTVNGLAASFTENGAGGTRITHLAHGLVTVGMPNANVLVAGAQHLALNGPQLVQFIDANTYDVALALPAGYIERNVAVTAQGRRASTVGDAPLHATAAPSEHQKRDAERTLLAHGSVIDKGRMVSALAQRRQHMAAPASCTGVNCAFVNLRRH